jgi:hypothetical protein
MGKIYKDINNFLPQTPRGVFVEIGSDRGEGSTHTLAELAQQHNTRLITVDISSKAQSRLSHTLPNTDFVVASGSVWARDFANTHTNIAVLYLDNFDYIWDIDSVSAAIRQQMHDYAGQGIVMSNQNCQIEHMRQMVALTPLLSSDAVVAFDDTYCVNDCWIGKCGPAVVYLQSLGWTVVHQTLDCGVIMKKLDNTN